MKKILNLLLVFMIIITMTGCEKKEQKERTALEVLNDTIKNEVSNGKVETIMNLKINTQGMSIDTNVSLALSLAKENNNYKLLFELSDNPIIEGGLKAYVDITNTTIKAYFPSTIYDLILGEENEDTKWIKVEDDYENVIEDENTLVNINDYITEKDFYLVSREGNIGTYCLVISNELLNKLANDTDYEVSNLKNDFKINILIDEKSNRILSTNIDIMEFINNLELDEESVDYKEIIEKFTIQLNVTYDNINVIIPDEVINSAVTSDEYLDSIYVVD